MVDQVDKVVGQLERFTERLIIKITLDVTANLIETTPVDTGWARANWVPAIGRPVIQDLRDIDPTTQGAAARSSRQQSSLASVAAQYQLRQGAVFISNNVPYITRLNDGHSKQQPSGFVQRAITKAVTSDIRSIAT